MRTEKREIGDYGESVACKFLMKRNFSILDRNYLKPWGEIDIVAKLADTYHFIEVKTTSADLSVTHETRDTWQAEDNIHPAKLKRLCRTIQTYLLDKDIEDDWQLDAIIVKLDDPHKKVKVRFIENIVL